MDWTRIIRVLQRNLPLLIGVPLVLIIIVRILRKDVSEKYESETTIYTGIASGLTLDPDRNYNVFATNNMFDNMINIIKSREVAAETSLRLFTQNLMLEKSVSEYISEENYKNLQQTTPEYIKKLIHQKIEPSTKGSHINSKPSDTIYLKNEDFIFQNQLFHKVKPDETILFLAKQYGVSVSELMNNNQLTSYSLTPGHALFIKNIAKDTTGKMDLVFDTIGLLKPGIDQDKFEKNFKIIWEYAFANDTNYLYRLLNSDDPFYSIKTIQSVTVRRVQNSDLINIKYTSTDPGICRQTLLVLTDVFINRYKTVNENRSDAVVKYFTDEVNKAALRLRNAEDQLLEFNKTNNIINYYEQSKAVADMKEKLDQEYNNAMVKFEASAAVLNRLEEKLSVQGQIQLKTDQIINTRNKLSDITSKITITEVYNDPNPKNRAKLVELKAESERLKKQLEEYVNQLYSYTNTIDGLPLDNLLEEWLTNVIAYEESRATMQVLSNRIKDFFEYYKTFAPLGSTQKRIEREIGVAEEEYLSLLQSLNSSKLRQQNIELASNIKALDAPYFPLKPMKSKEFLIYIIAAAFGFFFVAFIIIALELLDNTIRTPERLEELARLRLAGVFPRIQKRYTIYNLPFITNRLIELIVYNIKLNTRDNVKHGGPIILLLFSPSKKEGKTFIGARIAEKLREFGEKTSFLTFVRSSTKDENQWLFASQPETSNPIDSTDDLRKTQGRITKKVKNKSKSSKTLNNIIPLPSPNEDNFKYLIDPHFPEIHSLNEMNFIDSQPIFNQYKNIIIEIPGIIFNPYPIDIVTQADLGFMVVRANRTWKKSDALALFNMTKLLKEKPIAILNGVEIEALETVLGELPRPRSRIRRFVKKMLYFQLGEKSLLT
ncbi:MAG: hypothetical protein STSR0006_02460 [Lentimicrobium sp.]